MRLRIGDLGMGFSCRLVGWMVRLRRKATCGVAG